MYAIRVDDERKLLRIQLSGRMSSDEALRAVSQAYTLAEASGIQAILCELQNLRRGPGGTLLLGAALAAGYRDGMRIAFVAEEEGQGRFVERLVRFSGLGAAVDWFATIEEAGAFLAPLLRDVRAGRPSLLQEAEELLGRPVVIEGRGGRRRRFAGADPAA